MKEIAGRSAAAVLAALLAGPAAAADAAGEGWFQYRGPARDGRSSETGLVRGWGEAGPRELWRIPIGPGFSAISVVGDRLYTMGSDTENEYAVSFDAATGAEAWRVEVGALFKEGYGDGPRSTPTVVDGRVYALGSRGRLPRKRDIGVVEMSRETLQQAYAWYFDDYREVAGVLLPHWMLVEEPLFAREYVFDTTEAGAETPADLFAPPEGLATGGDSGS